MHRRRGTQTRSKSPNAVRDIALKRMSTEDLYPCGVLYKFDTENGDEGASEIALEKLRNQISREKLPSAYILKYFINTEAVMEQLSLTFGLVLNYKYFVDAPDEELMLFRWIFVGAVAVLTLLCYATSSYQQIPQYSAYGLMLFTFSPMLRTLTASYDTDTVMLLASYCGLCNILFYQYDRSAIRPTVAFLMCLLLSSRYENTEQVATYLFASSFFILMIPRVGSMLRHRFEYNVIGYVINIAAVPLLFYRSSDIDLAMLYVYASGMITIVSPILLCIAGQFKNIIRGPWDVASIEDEPESST